MYGEFLQYFKPCKGFVPYNEFYYDPRCSVRGKSSYRFEEAEEQARRKPVPVKDMIKYVNEFLKGIGMQVIEEPTVSFAQDKDLDTQLKEVNEQCSNNIVWMKFTADGFCGVVASSNDINFNIPQSEDDYKISNSAGILLHKLGKTWDTSFVLVFPLNIPIGYTYTIGDIESGIGNYLISRDVPILDYYSHNYTSKNKNKVANDIVVVGDYFPSGGETYTLNELLLKIESDLGYDKKKANELIEICVANNFMIDCGNGSYTR